MIDPIALIELTNLKAAGKLEELAAHPQLGMKPDWIGELAQSGNPTGRNHPDQGSSGTGPRASRCDPGGIGGSSQRRTRGEGGADVDRAALS